MIYIVIILVLITVIYFSSIAWIIIGFSLEKRKSKHEVKETSKQISIIIPVRNEEKTILNCLESIKKQDYNIENFEVIIINDHSTDNTESVINEFLRTVEFNINLFSLTDKKSKKEALTYGISKSNYAIIATTDADCTLPKNWLKNISSEFNNGGDMLIGPVMFQGKNGLLSNFQALDMLAIQGMEFGAIYFKKPILNNAANLSYLKESYHDVGGFDSFNTPSGDDIFLLERFSSNEKEIKGLLSKDFVIQTKTEPTLTGFINQRLRWSSKAKYYSSNLLIFFSGMVLIQNISMLFIYFAIPLVEKYSIIFIILLFCKWLIDFILLLLVASFFERRKTLFYFIPVQVIYPIYILFIWIVSMVTKFEWKGRKF